MFKSVPILVRAGAMMELEMFETKVNKETTMVTVHFLL